MSKIAAYEKKKEQARKAQAAASAAGRDIGKIPPLTADATARREEAWNSFKRFCEIYFSAVFCKPWSPDHLILLSKLYCPNVSHFV